MDPHSPHKLFATKYCFLIPGDDTSFFFFISFFFGFLLFHVIISFYKIIIIIIIIIVIIFFFHENYLLFFHVQECSGMFRYVPKCSVFRILSTPAPSTCIRKFLNQDFFFGRIRLSSTHIRWIQHTKPQLFQSSLKCSPEWIFLNTLWIRNRAKYGYFFNSVTLQNRAQFFTVNTVFKMATWFPGSLLAE